MTSEWVDNRQQDLREPSDGSERASHACSQAGRPDGAIFERVFAWWCDRNGALFALALCTTTVLRSGWASAGRFDPQLEFARQFPTPVNSYKATSVLGPALASLLGVTTKAGFRQLHAGMTAAFAVVAWCLILRLFSGRDERRALAILLMLGPVPVVLLQLIGHYDLFTLFAAMWFGLSASTSAAFVAGLLAGLSNGEQGIVMAAAAACASFGLHGKWSLRAFAFASGCLLARLFVWRWFLAYGFEASDRLALVDNNLTRAFESFLRMSTLATYSWYGPLWIFVFAAIWAQRFDLPRALALASGLVLIPALATIFTLDGTRVFACCAFPALCILLREVVARRAPWTKTLPLRAILGAFVLALPVLPAYLTWLDARIRVPWP